MKLPTFLTICWLYWGGQGFARADDTNPQDGLLVDCGAAKAVVFGHTESADGRYAFA